MYSVGFINQPTSLGAPSTTGVLMLEITNDLIWVKPEAILQFRRTTSVSMMDPVTGPSMVGPWWDGTVHPRPLKKGAQRRDEMLLITALTYSPLFFQGGCRVINRQPCGTWRRNEG